MQKIVQRAIDRGEVPAGVLPPRVVSLPIDLFRHKLLMTLDEVPEATVIDIVDTVFMPLVAAYAARATPPTPPVE